MERSNPIKVLGNISVANWFRVINVLKKWIEHNFTEINADKNLQDKFAQLVKMIADSPQNGKWGEVLSNMVQEETAKVTRLTCSL